MSNFGKWVERNMDAIDNWTENNEEMFNILFFLTIILICFGAGLIQKSIKKKELDTLREKRKW